MSDSNDRAVSSGDDEKSVGGEVGGDIDISGERMVDVMESGSDHESEVGTPNVAQEFGTGVTEEAVVDMTDPGRNNESGVGTPDVDQESAAGEEDADMVDISADVVVHASAPNIDLGSGAAVVDADMVDISEVVSGHVSGIGTPGIEPAESAVDTRSAIVGDGSLADAVGDLLIVPITALEVAPLVTEAIVDVPQTGGDGEVDASGRTLEELFGANVVAVVPDEGGNGGGSVVGNTIGGLATGVGDLEVDLSHPNGG
jgi:hypothetical protein